MLGPRRRADPEVVLLTRYVIRPDVAVRLAQDRTVVAAQHQLVAPTLLRSQVLSLLYREVRAGETSREQAERRLDHIRALRIRLLGDRVLQHLAWRVADQLGLPDTEDAEYLALTQLQADALISLDRGFAELAERVVTVAPFTAISAAW